MKAFEAYICKEKNDLFADFLELLSQKKNNWVRKSANRNKSSKHMVRKSANGRIC